LDTELRLDPAERSAWLHGACGDDELRSEVNRLLDHDASATRDGFLPAPDAPSKGFDSTATWAPGQRDLPGVTAIVKLAGTTSLGSSGGFTPKAAICAGTRSQPSISSRSLAQQRLRDLAILYLLIAGLMLFWKYGIVTDPDPTQAIPYVFVLAALGCVITVLSRRKPLTSYLLKVVELGMIVVVAADFALAQYQAMPRCSKVISNQSEDRP
jgi:serine/threonine-protein kinase